MTTVVNRGNDSMDKMYRIFRKQVEKSGLFGELRKREHFEKPSVRRKKKHLAALKRLQKAIKEELES